MNRILYRDLSKMLILIGTMILWTPCEVYAQNTLKGQVVYAAVNKKKVIKRGSNYRNRGKKVSSENKRKKDVGTKAEHTIISVKPLDVDIALNSSTIMLRQREKTFEPHVLAITKGSKVEFTNEDDFYHNVFSLSKGSRFNIGRKKPGKMVSKTFNKPGLIKVFCEIHPQMSAYILCLDTPYFSTVDKAGEYQISNLPDGRYKLRFFNPSVEIEDQTLVLSGGKIIKKDFIISPDRSSAFVDFDKRWYAVSCCTGTMCSHNEAQ